MPKCHKHALGARRPGCRLFACRRHISLVCARPLRRRNCFARRPRLAPGAGPWRPNNGAAPARAQDEPAARAPARGRQMRRTMKLIANDEHWPGRAARAIDHGPGRWAPSGAAGCTWARLQYRTSRRPAAQTSRRLHGFAIMLMHNSRPVSTTGAGRARRFGAPRAGAWARASVCRLRQAGPQSNCGRRSAGLTLGPPAGARQTRARAPNWQRSSRTLGFVLGARPRRRTRGPVCVVRRGHSRAGSDLIGFRAGVARARPQRPPLDQHNEFPAATVTRSPNTRRGRRGRRRATGPRRPPRGARPSQTGDTNLLKFTQTSAPRISRRALCTGARRFRPKKSNGANVI